MLFAKLLSRPISTSKWIIIHLDAVYSQCYLLICGYNFSLGDCIDIFWHILNDFNYIFHKQAPLLLLIKDKVCFCSEPFSNSNIAKLYNHTFISGSCSYTLKVMEVNFHFFRVDEIAGTVRFGQNIYLYPAPYADTDKDE